MRQMRCSLCHQNNLDLLGIKNPRQFYYCNNCQLIFVDTKDRLSSLEEKERYLLHQNNLENEGYVKFLRRSIAPSLSYLTPGMKGLDYGCGPGPVLVALLEQQNLQCDGYDPFFFPEGIKAPAYDFIFSTECMEHFFDPAQEIERIERLIKPGGYWILMTDLWKDLDKFELWYYKNDPAHVCFYHYNTIKYIALHGCFTIVFSDNNRVAILKKK